MKSLPLISRLAVFWSVLGVAPIAFADRHVAVTASANAEYTKRKYAGEKPQAESYVFMEGKYFDGVTVDRSIEKMSFRRIAEFLAPELARQQYFPSIDPKNADILLVVHWGTTVPRNFTDQMRGIATISTENNLDRDIQNARIDESSEGNAAQAEFLSLGDEASRKLEFGLTERTGVDVESDMQNGTNAQLLGYTRELRRLQTAGFSREAEATLRADLASERYFIIIKAYDLRDKVEPGQNRRSVWTMHLNTSSPGNNFSSALKMMGTVAVDYFGRNTDGVKTARPANRTGTVSLAPIVILGEVK